MKKILVVIPVFVFLLVGLVQAQTKNTGEDLVKQMERVTDAMMSANHNARFTCPRYLLRWSMELYKLGTKEEAIKLAEVAKRISEIATREISTYTTDLDTRYPKELNDPAIKQKMINYLQAMIQVAEEHIKYFKSGDEKIIDSLDKYFDEASKYDKDIEKMLKAPIATGREAIDQSGYLCPRWLTTFSEFYNTDLTGAIGEERGYYKSFAACGDCADIVKGAKDISEVFAKRMAANIQDPVLKEKWAAYIKAVQDTNDAFIKFYETGDKNLSEAPYKCQEKALQLDKEIDDYVASTKKK